MHAPVKTGECKACHVTHAGDEKKLLHAVVPDLCYKCHDATNTEEDPARDAHDPLGKNTKCLTCHNPHAAPEKGLMKTEAKVEAEAQ